MTLPVPVEDDQACLICYDYNSSDIIAIRTNYFFVKLLGIFFGIFLKYLNVGFMWYLNDPQNLDLFASALSHVSWTTFQLFELCYMFNITIIWIIYSIAYLRRSWRNWSRTCTSPIEGWKETTPKTRGTHTIATIRLARGKPKNNSYCWIALLLNINLYTCEKAVLY